MNPLITYLNQIRPYINAVAINDLAGTENLLGKHFHYIDTNGEKGQLLSPKRYFDVLSALIKAFGMVNIGDFAYYDTLPSYILGLTPDYSVKGSIRFSLWDKTELIEHFTAQQELTTAQPG